ncbi:MAB_1171c family putative transporter [Salinispora oceanensis]|uniref:MAB_1171c family putative transporter n=1 Tax=Salinispora oceanensis TaxID=1050199 RepID=UPI000371C5F5|nr:MAB_1171c family putative transporter [Salinispora oceanensis]
MAPALLAAVVVTLWIGVVNKSIQLSRAPDDHPLRALTACIACVAAMFTLALPSVSGLLDQVATGLHSLTINLGTMTAAYLLLAFFTYTVRGPAAQRRVRSEALILLAALAMVTATWSTAPLAVQTSPASTAVADDPHAAAFVLAVLGYLGYVHSQTLCWCVGFARVTRVTRLRRGLVMICLAVGMFLAAELTKSALAVAQLVDALPPPAVGAIHGTYVTLVGVGTLTFVVGVSYSAFTGMLAAASIWRVHRRQYRELQPLWSALHEAFPDLALSRLEARPWYKLFGQYGTHRRFYRRVIEIRDGLVQLAPYYDRTATADIEAELRQAGMPDADIADIARAKMIRAALRARDADPPVAAVEPPVIDGGHDLDSDARSLVRIARQMREHRFSDRSTPDSSSISAAP